MESNLVISQKTQVAAAYLEVFIEVFIEGIGAAV